MRHEVCLAAANVYNGNLAVIDLAPGKPQFLFQPQIGPVQNCGTFFGRSYLSLALE